MSNSFNIIDDYDPEAYDLTRNVHRITLYNTIASDQQHPSNQTPRLYLHVDMNCFYAQVEQQCYNLYGIPVIVGGWRKGNGIPRGIVATSSYEARAFGVKTGMSHLEAQQLCPYLVPLQVHWDKYQAISKEVARILARYAPEVEAYSSDESFLNISYLLGQSREKLAALGKKLKGEIWGKTRLMCSVGISYSKTYAKLASDLQKPDGLSLVLTPEEAVEAIYPLPLNEVWGIGRKRFAKLEKAGLATIREAVEKGPGVFQRLFGAYFGRMLWETATGKDCARVMDNSHHVPREVTYMHTFSDWTVSLERVKGEIAKGVRQLCYRLRGYNRRAHKYSGYIRFQDVDWNGAGFAFATKGLTNLNDYVLPACLQMALPMLKRFLQEGHKIRGFGLSSMGLDESRQLELFFREDEKLHRLHYAVDRINNRFGLDTVMPAATKYAVEGKTHFLERSG